MHVKLVDDAIDAQATLKFEDKGPQVNSQYLNSLGIDFSNFHARSTIH
jgi:hypothetical protein